MVGLEEHELGVGTRAGGPQEPLLRAHEVEVARTGAARPSASSTSAEAIR